MFSGIVEEVGRVLELSDSSDGRRLKISAPLVSADAVLGASISVAGCCLTVTEFAAGGWFVVEATHETLRRTTLGQLDKGKDVNLERALRLSDRLGGHLVSGHVDAIGRVSKIEEEGFSWMVSFEAEAALAPFFVEKGSVAIEGVSLTIVDLQPEHLKPGEKYFTFRVALIPHTMQVTSLGSLRVGDQVNIETDVVARYVARWIAPYGGEKINKDHATLPFALGQG
jgi:riboflavin synthase